MGRSPGKIEVCRILLEKTLKSSPSSVNRPTAFFHEKNGFFPKKHLESRFQTAFSPALPVIPP
jgi:hypothetical protein